MQTTIAQSVHRKTIAVANLVCVDSTADPPSTASETLARPGHPGMLRLDYLRKMLLYSLLCLLAKALTANPCFGLAMQYCQLRTPNALVVFAKAFRWHTPSEALFFSFI